MAHFHNQNSCWQIHSWKEVQLTHLFELYKGGFPPSREYYQNIIMASVNLSRNQHSIYFMPVDNLTLWVKVYLHVSPIFALGLQV